VTEAIAVHALAHRKTILSRLETVAVANLSMLKQFMSEHRGSLGWVAPAGGTVAFPWRLDGANARAMCEALAREGVLVAPGDCFDAPEHFRIGFGAEEHGFREALEIASGEMGPRA
jgi:aspartate/methionine/tyrosine aminotransferase